ncbi:MAG: MurR/RpiR family transcriptional regulator [Desulfobacterales bacterium]|jgi:DNA-binding MurR/RpiR family transcriptional regulator|nr:MurR/RpiR family transcriptional regulator [Desulfobacterales bacterium]
MPYTQLLAQQAGELTPAQRKLFDYILDHDEEAVFLNIHELSERVGISVATVVRLSRALGFKGFPEFQQQLRRLFKEKLTTIARLEKSGAGEAGDGRILLDVMRRDIDNITETMNQVATDDFRRFVDALNTAERIVIVGLRSAHSLAVFMGVALEFLQREVWIARPGIGDMWDRMFRLSTGDVVVGISFPRYTRETVQALAYAKRRSIRALAITDSPVSPLARHADVVLTARCKMDSFVESFTAPLSLINAVVTAVGLCRKQETLSGLKQLEELWRDRNTYFDGDNGHGVRPLRR